MPVGQSSDNLPYPRDLCLAHGLGPRLCATRKTERFHTSSSSSAKPLPPKHTSTRHDIEGMNLCSFALQVALAPSSFDGSQLLMSGRLLATTGVLVWKRSSPGGTPVVPRRDLTMGLASSAGFPLKFPQCPSWPGCGCMVILTLM